MKPNDLVSTLRSLFALLAGVSGLTIMALPAQAQNDWAACANEGSACRFNGEALVRFGVPGKYAFRVGRDGVDCDTDSFGDPAPGVRKRCEVSYRWRSDARYRGWRRQGSQQGANWRFCADEGGVCEVDGAAKVRFGANGRYETRSVNGRVACNVDRFGDPMPGVRKQCELYEAADWVWCANEGEVCRLPAPAQVRYGAGGRYAYQQAGAAVVCHNGVFGDPMPGVAKQCEYRSTEGGGAVPGPVAGGLQWDFCARENGYCNVSGATMVRYGQGGRFSYREVQRGVDCNSASFGADPAPAQRKQCEVLRLTR